VAEDSGRLPVFCPIATPCPDRAGGIRGNELHVEERGVREKNGALSSVRRRAHLHEFEVENGVEGNGHFHRVLYIVFLVMYVPSQSSLGFTDIRDKIISLVRGRRSHTSPCPNRQLGARNDNKC
jgi:hypothetical protein